MYPLNSHLITPKIGLQCYQFHRHLPTKLVIATFVAPVVLLFHIPAQYGSARLRQIFVDHPERWLGIRLINMLLLTVMGWKVSTFERT